MINNPNHSVDLIKYVMGCKIKILYNVSVHYCVYWVTYNYRVLGSVLCINPYFDPYVSKTSSQNHSLYIVDLLAHMAQYELVIEILLPDVV